MNNVAAALGTLAMHLNHLACLSRDPCVGLTDFFDSFDFNYARRDTPARPSRRLSRSLSCLSTPVTVNSVTVMIIVDKLIGLPSDPPATQRQTYEQCLTMF